MVKKAKPQELFPAGTNRQSEAQRSKQAGRRWAARDSRAKRGSEAWRG